MALLKSLARRMAVEKDEEIWLMEHPRVKVWVVRKAREMGKGLRRSLMAHKKLMVPEKELQMENLMDVLMAMKWVQLMVEKRLKVC